MNTKLNTFYIYKHTFKNNVIYIGKGNKKRAYSTKRNDYWNKLYKKYGMPIIDFLHKELSEDKAFELEIEEIKRHKENGFILCNLTDGGEGSTGYKHTKESLAKMSGINNPMYGKVADQHHSFGKNHSEQSKKMISINKIGKKLSIETRLKMSVSKIGKNNPIHNIDVSGKNNNFYGKTHTEETKLKMSELKKGKAPHNKNIPMSEEQKLKLSEASKKWKRFECEHCGIVTTLAMYNRWHGIKCKKI